jgi:tetratricopeptide (TPR) repeat protein
MDPFTQSGNGFGQSASESSIDQLALSAAAAETLDAHRLVFTWISILAIAVASPRIALYGIVGIVVVTFAFFLTLSVVLKRVRLMHADGITKELRKARKQDIAITLRKEGKRFLGVAQQACPGLPLGAKINFDLKPKLAPPAFYYLEPTNATVYFTHSTNKPYLVAVGTDAFLINENGLMQSAATTLTYLTGFAGVALLIMCTSNALNSGCVLRAGLHTIPAKASAEEYYNLGMQYKGAGWTEQSRMALQRAIEVGADSETARSARRFLVTKLPRNPASDDAVQMNIEAYNLDAAGNTAQAEKVWLECIKKYPKFEWAYGNLGDVYVQQGKFTEGDALLTEALEINPNYVNALLHLAESKCKQNDKAAAREYLERAQSLDPTDYNVQAMQNLLK